MERIFRILEDTNTQATFFIIGWIAKNYPDIVKDIAAKYQIGSHTMNHQLVWQQSIKEFKEDVSSSVKLLEDISGKKVEAFRAPGFSIRESEAWAFEVLHDLGIRIDCSVFPSHHAHGGMPTYSVHGPTIICTGGIEIKEFPITYKEILGKHIIFSGGGYFRFFPYWLINKWSRESNGYLLSYIHPRDMDYEQPVIEELSLLRRFKSYCGLKNAEGKLRQWLTDFQFTDLATAENMVDWDKVEKLEIA